MTSTAKGYEVVALEHVVVARWLRTPTVSDAAGLRADLKRELTRQRRPIWIVIDAERIEPPPSEVRAELQETGKEIFALATSVDIVILGEGVRAMLMRTVLRGMALITRTSDRLHVHQGVNQAVAARQPDAALEKLLRDAE